MKSQIFLAAAMILTIVIAGCASTGQVTENTQQPVQPTDTVSQPSAPPTPSPQPTTTVQPTTPDRECDTNANCPSGQSCLQNTCVKIQFVK